VQDPSIKVPVVTYLQKDQVSVPELELTEAKEEGSLLLKQVFQLLKDRFETLCVDVGNHGPFVEAGVSTVTEQSVFIGGSAPIFELLQVLCKACPDRFVAEEQPLLALPPSDFDLYTGSPGDDFVMFREKQHHAIIEHNPYNVNFVRGTGVSGPSLLKNADWNVVGMVVCLWRSLPGPWQLRSVGDIEIAPLTWHFLLKDHSKLRALPAAQARWASSFVRGVSKAFKLKLDLEIPRDFGSPVLGGEIFKGHIDKVMCLFFIFHDNGCY
jgi:hypothetical protein